MPKKNLESPGRDYLPTTEPAKIWLVGHLFSLSDAFGNGDQWIDHNTRISIKPGETGDGAYLRQFGEALPSRHFVFEIDR